MRVFSLVQIFNYVLQMTISKFYNFNVWFFMEVFSGKLTLSTTMLRCYRTAFVHQRLIEQHSRSLIPMMSHGDIFCDYIIRYNLVEDLQFTDPLEGQLPMSAAC